MFEADDRDFTQPQSPRRIYAAVAGEEVTVLIGQNRDVEAERLDAAGDLFDLPIGVKSRIAGIEPQPLDPNASMLRAICLICRSV